MVSLASLHLLFTLLAAIGMLLIGYSFITLHNTLAVTVAGLSMIGVAAVFWFAAFRKIVKLTLQAGRDQQAELRNSRLFFGLPAMLNQILVPQTNKTLERSLPYSICILLIVFLVSLLLYPSLAPLLLLALLLVMMRQAKQWALAENMLQMSVPAVSAEQTTRKSLPFAVELVGILLFKLLLSGIVVVFFNAFFVVPFDGRLTRAQQKLVEIELKQAMEVSSAYLADHADQRITTPQQLAALGWQETDRIRLVQVDLTAKGGSITMQYTQRTGSRREPVTVKTVYDGETVRMERMP